MLARNPTFKTRTFHRQISQFQIGDRVETYNHCIGTIVRIDHDRIGVFIVARLDIIPGEFAYDPDDLQVIQS